MDFGLALIAMRDGMKLQRLAWSAHGAFVFLVPGSTFQANRAPLLGIYPEGTNIKYQAHLDMRTTDGTIGPWNPTCADLLAKDWSVLPKTNAVPPGSKNAIA